MPEQIRSTKHGEEVMLSGEIRLEGDQYVSSLKNGASIVRLPHDIGEMMQQILRIQDRIQDKIQTDPRTRTLVSLLNCRKTAALASGALSPRDAVDTSHPQVRTKSEIRDALDDPYALDQDGILEMLRDVERLIRAGAVPTLWTPEHERITTQLRDEKFPKVVHIFAPPESVVIDTLLVKIATRTLEVDDFIDMGFIHTFVVTGKSDDGTYHCFHKQGPSLNEKVEVTSLQDLFAYQFSTTMNRQYLSIAGPLK